MLRISKYSGIIRNLISEFDGKEYNDFLDLKDDIIDFFLKHNIVLEDWEDYGELTELEYEDGEYERETIWAGIYTGPYASPDNRAIAFIGIWSNSTPLHYADNSFELFPDPTESWDEAKGIGVYETLENTYICRELEV